MIEPKEKALTLDPQEVAALAWERLFAGVPDEDVKLALAICGRYGLDPLLRHVVLVPGGKSGRHSVYITRDGLLHVAHASGRAWSLEVGEPERRQNPYSGKEDIYLRGRLRVADQEGREQVFEGGVWFSEYAQKGGAWSTHPAAMHQKVLEVYLLRRAFDVALTPLEEVGGSVEALEARPSLPEGPSGKPLPAPSGAQRVKELLGVLGLEREEARRLVSRIVEREVRSFRDLEALEVDLALEELERLAALPPEKREEALRAYLAQEEVEL